MYCPVESRIYLKANGEVPCWCAYGEKKILHTATAGTDFVEDVLAGESYGHIRDALSRNRQPWPKYCTPCFFLEPDDHFRSKFLDQQLIDSIQIEPSFLCQLDCIACSPPRKKRTRVKSPPHIMPLELFSKLVDDLKRSGIFVRYFEFQGRGEPLMNKDVWKMVAYARRLYPDSIISLMTNGNFPYTDDSVRAGLSEFVFAVDGCFQKSYETYRRHGDIDKPLEFMEKFANEKKKHGTETRIVWKYILFAHNDSEREIIETQRRALLMGVDEIWFQVTPFVHTCKPTRFIEKSELMKFPLIDTQGNLRVVTPDVNPVNTVIDKVWRGKTGFILKWMEGQVRSLLRI
jgi:hypothetical protein